MIKSYSFGHEIIFENGKWIYLDSKKPININRKCRRCGKYQIVLEIDGKLADIDYCILDVVTVLNNGGIKTIACCCGHGKVPGIIALSDGRELSIKPVEGDQCTR